MKKIAVIDLGSNSIRMSIFDPENPKTALKTYRSTIRLSEGMSKTDMLSTEAQLRAVKALSEYKKIAKDECVTDIYTVATAAVRKAKNQAEFLGLVKSTLGLEIKVIDGKTEAKLDSLAISRALSLSSGLICDIGGGSTELIGVPPKSSPMVSIPYGSRGITEMFFKDGESSASFQKALDFTRELLSPYPWLSDFYERPLVGIGGTLRALAKMNFCDDSSKSINGCEISPDVMNQILDTILSADFEKRSQMPGIGTERADIILGGVILLKAVLERLNPSKILVSDAGVREGVFFDLIEGHQILSSDF